MMIVYKPEPKLGFQYLWLNWAVRAKRLEESADYKGMTANERRAIARKAAQARRGKL